MNPGNFIRNREKKKKEKGKISSAIHFTAVTIQLLSVGINNLRTEWFWRIIYILFADPFALKLGTYVWRHPLEISDFL